jgi:hypothetical protein
MIRPHAALAAVLVLAWGGLAPNAAHAAPWVAGGCDCLNGGSNGGLNGGFNGGFYDLDDGFAGAWGSPYRPVTWGPSLESTAQEVRNRLSAQGITMNPPPLALTPTPKQKAKEKEPDK